MCLVPFTKMPCLIRSTLKLWWVSSFNISYSRCNYTAGKGHQVHIEGGDGITDDTRLHKRSRSRPGKWQIFYTPGIFWSTRYSRAVYVDIQIRVQTERKSKEAPLYHFFLRGEERDLGRYSETNYGYVVPMRCRELETRNCSLTKKNLRRILDLYIYTYSYVIQSASSYPFARELYVFLYKRLPPGWGFFFPLKSRHRWCDRPTGGNFQLMHTRWIALRRRVLIIPRATTIEKLIRFW